jgi:uncharacterized protein (TIGR02284 family)
MSSHDVRVLNDLVEIALDSADGYTEAARDTRAARYSAAFQARASERRQLAARLQRQVAELGGDAERDGSALASAHRMFVNLQQTMRSGDQAVVAEVERGENYIEQQFQRALHDDGLGPSTHAVIEEACRVVQADREQVGLLQRAASRR